MKTISTARKWLLVFFFSVAQFIDVCNISELFAAIPTLMADLGMSESQSVWLISGYQLTFSSFLLMGGRMSDVYNAKYVFSFGFGVLGIFSIGAGFVNDKIGLIILRAITGIFAAFTIPSALSLIVHIFPEPREQGQAIACFGGAGSYGSMLGLVIGAIFTQLVSWRWIFFFNAIISIPTAIASFILVPQVRASRWENDDKTRHGKGVMGWIRLQMHRVLEIDVPGIALLTISVILFIFAVTSGSTTSWGTARVLVPLIASVIIVTIFFFYEARIPPERAALPPQVWWYKNFSVFFGLALLPYLWFTGVFLLYTTLYQDVFRWNPLITAVHFLPIGITGFITLAINIGYLQKKLSYRANVLIGGLFTLPGTILLTVADSRDKYWSYMFPAFIIGCIGIVQIFLTANVAIIACAPRSQSGIVGAVFNAALQLGAAVGSAAITSIQQNVDAKQPDPRTTYAGRRAGFWFIVAVVIVEMIAFIIFYRTPNTEKETGSPTETLVEAPEAQEENAMKAESTTESAPQEKEAVEKDLESQTATARNSNSTSNPGRSEFTSPPPNAVVFSTSTPDLEPEASSKV